MIGQLENVSVVFELKYSSSYTRRYIWNVVKNGTHLAIAC